MDLEDDTGISLIAMFKPPFILLYFIILVSFVDPLAYSL